MFIVPYRALALPPAAAAAWAVRAERRRRRREKAGHCLRCGYDLRATPGACPECGAAAATAGDGDEDVRRRLFNLASALSLLLCVAAAGMWVRGRWVHDQVHRGTGNVRDEQGWVVHDVWLDSVVANSTSGTCGRGRIARRA